jgi:hypothetical protein
MNKAIPDFQVVWNGGTIGLVYPNTSKAKECVAHKFELNYQTFCGCIVIEQKYINPLKDRLVDGGYSVQVVKDLNYVGNKV